MAVKTAGDYALEYANGRSWADIVAEIRQETLMACVRDCVHPDDTDPGYTDSGSGVWS